jgi:hypothetical protein
MEDAYELSPEELNELIGALDSVTDGLLARGIDRKDAARAVLTVAAFSFAVSSTAQTAEDLRTEIGKILDARMCGAIMAMVQSPRR